ncbi:Arm DNA-binding domain-containing protein [uncultured Alistipes sp.]|uniref:Arm DNA-binding domain-containing protein n=1 Tax=uncultured Alistipes sp. TaxID=538949 RepID=UPI002617BCCD|nr:Arm DNA-binding domain-containing protein [uncultured Alistipes sp.]
MTFKVILRKYVVYKNLTSPLCLLFFHDNRKTSVGLGISAAREYWDAEEQKLKDGCPNRDGCGRLYPQTCHPQGGGATADAGEDTRRRFGLSGFRTGLSGDVLSLNQ